jgi:uncharacterized protein (TIGR02246 family)
MPTSEVSDLAFDAIHATGRPVDFTDDDLASVQALINAQRRAGRSGDVDGLRAIYAEDLHWMNAFGSRLIGRDAVLDYLATLWQTPQFRARGPLRDEHMDIWFLDGDKAVVHVCHEVDGQQTLTGQVLTRRTHSEKIVVRRDARWLIQSELFADERDQRERLITRTRQAGDEIRPLTASEVDESAGAP